MKIKSALKFILFFLSIFALMLTFSPHRESFAQIMIEQESKDVVVSANINVDLFSQLSLLPPTVEVKQPTTVSITVINPNGTPRAGRIVQIYVQGDSSGITITQPGVTDVSGKTTASVSSTQPGSYIICAKDTTEGYDITIEDCNTLYVIPVPPPTMLLEPEYTKGHENIVIWNMKGKGSYRYLVQVSTDSNFSSIKEESTWISNLSYEFTNLQNGVMYFYRVKARNSFGSESGWSNVVFSVQDSMPPGVELVSISDVGENSNVSWDRNYVIRIKYRITDNVAIDQKKFWCISNDGGRHDCLYKAIENGDFWDIQIQFKYLEKTSSGNLFAQYRFCAEASDSVTNISRNCEAKISVPVETPEEDIPQPIIPRDPVITSIKERIERFFDDTLLKLERIDLQDITIITAALNLTVGVGLLLSNLGYLPYLFLQLFFAIYTLLGLRKKGNVSGYVYNSLTKEPVERAVVKVFNEVHELIWTTVTDDHGYFRTIETKDGEYYITVTAKGFKFPSKVIFGKSDFPLENVYHGDPFLTREERIPNFSIPLDPEELSASKRNIAMFLSRTKFVWSILHIFLFLFGLILSIYALYVTPIWWNYLVLILYIPALLSFLSAFFGSKNKYGIVRSGDRKVVEGVIVGLTEKRLGKLISKRVTDSLGRYRFVVGQGEYELSVLNSDMKIEDIEKDSELLIEEEGGKVLAPDITVRKLEDEVGDELLEPLDEL